MKNNESFTGVLENPVYEYIISDLLEQRYSIIDGFFTSEEVGGLRDSLWTKYKNNRFKKAAIGSRTNEHIKKNIRGDSILWLDKNAATPSEERFFAKIGDLADYLNRTCFMGILHREFHYAVYPKGTFYKRHLDVFQEDDRRKLSFICYLNDETWKKEYGGELVLYPEENEIEKVETIYPFPGRTVIFESQALEHEVKPVLESRRLSITGWFKTR